jgi:hypothetical protein
MSAATINALFKRIWQTARRIYTIAQSPHRVNFQSRFVGRVGRYWKAEDLSNNGKVKRIKCFRAIAVNEDKTACQTAMTSIVVDER